jgi:hypothetical protein
VPLAFAWILRRSLTPFYQQRVAAFSIGRDRFLRQTAAEVTQPKRKELDPLKRETQLAAFSHALDWLSLALP